MRFANRDQAAHALAEALVGLEPQRPLVLGLPRGGVPMAAIIADRLGCEFDVVLVRKLRTPGYAELAMGAVDEAGHAYTEGNQEPVASDVYEREVAYQIAEIRRRRALYSATRASRSAEGHTAIIVDDGIATGATMMAAIRAVRAQRPLRIVVAAPVGARDALDLARSLADDVVCLYCPRVFFAVGEFYDDFSEVSDSTVVNLLAMRSK
jgi:putative phosphoribosyl transferase